MYSLTPYRYAIEVQKAIADQQTAFDNYDLNLYSQGEYTHKNVHNALKEITKQHTVPYVYVNGKFLGGCDDTKALIASGDFSKFVESDPKDVESGKVSVTSDSPNDKTTAPPPTIKPLFAFPVGVDNRVIRLVAFQVFIIAVLLAAFAHQKKQAWHWVAVALTADFVLRFLAGGKFSPIGNIALFSTKVYDHVGPKILGRPTGPIKTAGAPKQFAAFVGIVFSGTITALQFTDQWEAATAIAAILAFFAFLEWALNFCAGCLVFAYFVRFGLIGAK